MESQEVKAMPGEKNKIGIGIILCGVFFIIGFIADYVWILSVTIEAKIYILAALWSLFLLFVTVLAVICFYEDLSDEEKEEIKKAVKRRKEE